MAISGVRSNMPALGMMRRNGARIGSVILSNMIDSVLGLVRTQERIALRKMTMVSTSQRSLMKLNKKVMAIYLLNSLALL